MSNYQREEEILEILREQKYAEVEDLARQVHASPSSIRRYLTRLQELGTVKRSHGGAAILEGEPGIAPFAMRMNENRKEKKSLVKAASTLISPGSTIYIDSSTTAFALYSYLQEGQDLTVITNNIQLAQILSAKGVTSYCVGGKMSRHNSVITTGSFAIEMLKHLYVDLMFFSSSALSEEGMITDVDEEETEIRKMMLGHAEKKVFLHHKERFGRHARFCVASLDDVDELVTDQSLETEWLTKWPKLHCHYVQG